MSATVATAPTVDSDMSLPHVHLIRAGYLLMGVGLAVVKWPLLQWRDAWQRYVRATGDRWR